MDEEKEALTFEGLVAKVERIEERLMRHILRDGEHLVEVCERQIEDEGRINRAYAIAWFALGFGATAIITAIMVWSNR